MSNQALDDNFNPQEQGLLSELSNLISGATATALESMLNEKFTIGPVEQTVYTTIEELAASDLTKDKVAAYLSMSTQASVPFSFLIATDKAITLSDKLMGMAASEETEITEIQLSAIGEVLSQMMGAASSNLSQLFSRPVDFSSPETFIYTPEALIEKIPGLNMDGILAFTYTFESESLGKIQLYQLTPCSEIQKFIAQILQAEEALNEASEKAEKTIEIPSAPSVQSGVGPQQVTVQPVQFAALDGFAGGMGELNQNLGLVQDILLNMTVELGRSEITIREVLELTRGSVIELDRLAGESVDLLANGKLIAKGEIVVIEDNFGFRVTSIVSPQERLIAV